VHQNKQFKEQSSEKNIKKGILGENIKEKPEREKRFQRL